MTGGRLPAAGPGGPGGDGRTAGDLPGGPAAPPVAGPTRPPSEKEDAMREEGGRIRQAPAGAGRLAQPEATAGSEPPGGPKHEYPGVGDGEEAPGPDGGPRRPARPALAQGRPPPRTPRPTRPCRAPGS